MDKEKSSKPKTIDEKRGFNIRVNLYILRYFWRRLKNKDIWEDMDIYKLCSISRQRYNRIIGGSDFVMPRETVEKICGLINIETTYLEAEGPIIPVHGITDEDWKNGFDVIVREEADAKRRKEDRDPVENSDTEAYASKEIKRVLKEQATPGYIGGHYSPKDALFRIGHYSSRGTAYEPGTYVKELMDDLKYLSVKEWKRMERDKETLEQYREILSKHLEYINALLVIGKYTGQ